MPGASEVKAGGAYIEIGGETKPLKSALGAAKRSVKSFVAGIQLSFRAVSKAAGAIVSSIKKIAGAALSAANRIRQFASVQIRRGLTALSVGLGLAAREAISFEAGMAEVHSILNVSTKRFQELTNEVLEFARISGEAPQRLTASLYQLLSAGVGSANAMNLLTIATKAAVAGVTDTRTAVNALTSLLNAYGLSTDKAVIASDILFETVKQGKTTFAEIASTIGRVAPIAASMGVTLNDVGASLATLTKGGLSTDEAMTSIRAILVSVLKPSTEALKLAKKLGIAFNAEGVAAAGLGGFLQSVAKETEGNVDMLSTLFPNIRALNGVMSLAGSQSKEFSKQLKIMGNTAGATETAFQIIAKTIDFQLRKAWAGMKTDMIRIGNKIMPAVLASTQRLAGWLKKLADWVQTNSDGISAFFAEMRYWVEDAWMFIEKIILASMDAVQGEHDTFMDALEEKARTVWDAIVGIWSGIEAILRPIIQGVGNALKGDWEAAGEKWSSAVEKVTNTIFKILEATLPTLIELGSTMLASIITGLQNAEVIGKVKDLLDKLWQALTTSESLIKLRQIGRELGKSILVGVREALGLGISEATAQARMAEVSQPIRRSSAGATSRGGSAQTGAQTDPAMAGAGAGGATTVINNLFRPDRVDLEQMARDTRRQERRGRSR